MILNEVSCSRSYNVNNNKMFHSRDENCHGNLKQEARTETAGDASMSQNFTGSTLALFRDSLAGDD